MSQSIKVEIAGKEPLELPVLRIKDYLYRRR